MAGPDEPTDVMPGDDEEPTARLEEPAEEPTRSLGGTSDAPTENMPGGSEDPNDRFDSARNAGTEEMRVRGLASGDLPPVDPTEIDDRAVPGPPSRRGIGMLVGSIIASLILIGAYIAAGGLDYKPAKAADPCAARTWTDPGNLEETAQQFALSAADGAACELGVSREELIRALADEESRAKFAEENGFSESEVEDAIRAGINRAIDDAEEAGAINSLVASGLRAAARVLPVTELIPLLEDASDFLEGRSLNDIGGIIGGVVDSLGGGSDSGSDGSESEGGGGGGIGDQLRDALPDDLSGGSIPEDITEGLRDQLPDDVRRNIPRSVDKRIQEGIDGLLNP